MQNKIVGIYKIVSPSNKIYVGQTKNYTSRIKLYNSLRCKGQSKLYASFLKYGVQNHTFSLIEECAEDVLNEMEIKYIKEYNCLDKELGLNLKEGGVFGTHSEETRKKISEKNKMFYQNGGVSKNLGKKLSEETKEKLRKANLGKKQSEETKQKKREISLSLGLKPPKYEWTEERRRNKSLSSMGENNPNYGKAMKQHVKDKLKEVNSKKVLSEETRIKMSLARKGKKFSEEHKRKISESTKGKKKNKKCGIV